MKSSISGPVGEKMHYTILSLLGFRLSWVIRFCVICLLFNLHFLPEFLLSWCDLQSCCTFSVLSRLALSCYRSLYVLFLLFEMFFLFPFVHSISSFSWLRYYFLGNLPWPTELDYFLLL